MNKILTVVVPSYNAGIYLEETIPTMVNVSNQEMLEILIVNDGSTDNTLEIAKKLQEKHPHVITVIDKENGGHGSTINAGIKKAKGKYFKVIDADDWVNSSAFEQLITFLQSANSDLVISPYNEVYVDSRKEKIVTVNGLIDHHEQSYDQFLSNHGMLPQMHMITIKTDILQNHHITIGEKMFYVDMEYVIFPTPYVKTVTIFNEVVYQYRLGTLTQSVSVASFIRNRHMHANVILRIISYLKQVTLSKTVEKIVFERVMLMIDRHAKVLLSMSETKQAKNEFIKLEQDIQLIDHRFIDTTNSKLVNLLRKSKYLLFSTLSKVVRLRNWYLKIRQ